MAFDFTPTPHREAAALIAGKPVVTRAVFDALLPELRARAFTITGVEDATVSQRIRDRIADLPLGATWDEVKGDIITDLEAHLGDGAERRAELLLRTHGFQAFQASNWRVAQEDEDTTHLQYLATEDDRVRDSHLALNGVILPKNDPFWEKHLPPWEWGCRCRVRPMNPDLVEEARADDEDRAPEDRLVLEGPVADKLRQGQLQRGGRSYNVTPPGDTDRDGFTWHPDNIRLPLAELAERFDPEVWSEFKTRMEGTQLGDSNAWEWLSLGNRSQSFGGEMFFHGSGFDLKSAGGFSDTAPRSTQMDPISGIGHFFAKEESSARRFASGDVAQSRGGRTRGFVHEVEVAIKNPAKFKDGSGTSGDSLERFMKNQPLLSAKEQEAAFKLVSKNKILRDVIEPGDSAAALYARRPDLMNNEMLKVGKLTPQKMAEAARAALQAKGHDGVLLEDDLGLGRTAIAFSRDQIKIKEVKPTHLSAALNPLDVIP